MDEFATDDDRLPICSLELVDVASVLLPAREPPDGGCVTGRRLAHQMRTVVSSEALASMFG